MKNIYKSCLMVVIAFLFPAAIFSQSSETAKTIITADSIASGNSKDILVSFFQLAFNNLTGNNRELNFSGSPFAIMLKRNPDLALDRNYKKYKPLRKLNISFGVKLDSSFYFNGFSSGIKYSIIDHTDATASKFIFQKLRSNETSKQRDKLLDLVADYIDNNIPDINQKKKFTKNLNKFLITDKPFKDCDADFQIKVKDIATANNLDKVLDIFENKPDSSLKAIDHARYAALKNAIKNNLLWTIGISDTTYKDKFQFSNISIVSEISKGMFDPEPGDNNVEFTAKAAYNFLNDTLRKGRNLKREIFTTEAGFNWIIRDRSTDKSFFETKFSGTYYHNFASIYDGETRDSLTLNGTIRFRLMDDIWIPLEVKYDPKSGNIFGFLNIKANFSGLGKLLKQSAKL